MPQTDVMVSDPAAEYRNTDLADAASMRLLSPDNAVFMKTAGQMLSVRAYDKEHPAVYLHCSFPHTNSRIYISVRTEDNKEIGIIRSLDDFPEPVVGLLEEQIKIRYFAPEITKINMVHEEFGYSYWETETNAGNCRFTVRSGGVHVKMVTDRKVLITDVEGNRFTIEDINRLTEKEYRMVELFM
ncbi:DUF1854 domain-containing protein [Paenibacillus tarimensis]